MLRIEPCSMPNGAALLRLEGRLLGPWVAELDRVCAELLTDRRGLSLDLSGLAWVDAAGAALLERLQQRRVDLLNCPSYVAGQLQPAAERAAGVLP